MKAQQAETQNTHKKEEKDEQICNHEEASWLRQGVSKSKQILHISISVLLI